METGGSGRLYRWTCGPIPEEGGESGEKSGAAQSKGGGWEGSRDTEGDVNDPENSLNDGTVIDRRNISDVD